MASKRKDDTNKPEKIKRARRSRSGLAVMEEGNDKEPGPSRKIHDHGDDTATVFNLNQANVHGRTRLGQRQVQFKVPIAHEPVGETNPGESSSMSSHSGGAIPQPELEGEDGQMPDAAASSDLTDAINLETKTKTCVRSYENYTKLLDWIPLRQIYIGCRDCWDGGLLKCKDCMVSNHHNLPLHRVEAWNGDFFHKAYLYDLGLTVQLGHDGGPCPDSVKGPIDFQVFDTTGIFPVRIKYCRCRKQFGNAGLLERRIQLMRARLFPATLDRPQTAFTFEMLESFHKLTQQGKVTAYDFYNSIVQRSDRLELGSVPSRRNDFLRAFRFWRVLLMLKRAARGNQLSGVDGTSQGELTNECGACPIPGKNLPENWEAAGALLFLYTIFLAVDANFKLKAKDRKINDVELMPGWGCFVEESEYQGYLNDYIGDKEINTCRSEHDTIMRAATRSTPGYSVSGAGMVICSRHGLVRPNGVGDLQKGEIWSNMDYIIFSAVRLIILACILLTYDIACSWSKKVPQRIAGLPQEIRPNVNVRLEAYVPSWHINGHGQDCQTNYATVYREGTARTCGDEIEGNWSQTNVLGSSVREMGGAARHETLNDHFNGSNFRKIVGFRTLFGKKFQLAATMRAQHRDAFSKLSATFEPDSLRKWTDQIELWERDPQSSINPYDEVKLDTTLQDVRLQLTQEDAEEANKGIIAKHETTLTGFLVTGLELEEQQRSLKVEIETTKLNTSKQKADLEEKRTALKRRILQWRQVQLASTPSVATLLPVLDGSEASDVTAAEDIPLYLPSSFPPHLRLDIQSVAEKEKRLREAQADDALANIRLQRRIITGLTAFKKLQLGGAGNKPNTRVRTLHNRIQLKIRKAANRYRKAREALESLDAGGLWGFRLQPLRDEDISGPGRDPSMPSNSRYVMSWIWHTPRVRRELDKDMDKGEVDESLRVEWAKARARLRRWEEEYLLIQEEMRRVVAYLGWKAQWWQSHAELPPFKPVDIAHGVRAYALKQARMSNLLSQRCQETWIPTLAKHGETPKWDVTRAVPGSTAGRADVPHKHSEAFDCDDTSNTPAYDSEGDDEAEDGTDVEDDEVFEIELDD
ncbi:hypothetical protein BKA70DRAFT_1320196 [Coprinopsis sp. MPI-PUGE-AT-0042]|nr:hypothetical protein BKA70DRAFT_1320196 [Coprinopsis sp. MPI-PUGE-AT-0042]